MQGGNHGDVVTPVEGEYPLVLAGGAVAGEPLDVAEGEGVHSALKLGCFICMMALPDNNSLTSF